MKQVVDSAHFDDNSPIAERVAEGSQPGSEVASHRDCSRVRTWHWKEAEVNVENDGSSSYQVVEVRTAEANQPGENTITGIQYCNTNNPHFRCLKAKLNTRQTMANTTPAAASM